MGIQKFEDLIVWQKSQDLAVDIYSKFSSSKDFGFRDQILRASVSITNNIAEGFGRSSNADFSRFLYFAIGSASELKSMRYLSKRLGYTSEKETEEPLYLTSEVSKIIRGLLKSLTT